MTETLKEKLRHELDEDRAFLQKLKPRLIKARAKGELRATAPSSPQLPRPKQPGAGGPNPWLVLGAAFAVGFAVAKVIDWRGHAHPRR